MKTLFAAALLLILTPFNPLENPVPYKKMRVFVLVPPEQILTGIERIAVLDFAGRRRHVRELTDNVISQLLEPRRGIHDLPSGLFGLGRPREGRTLQEGAATNTLEVIERGQLDRVMEEQSLQASEMLDDEQVVSFGQLLGVQAIMTGNLTYTTDQARDTRRVSGGTESCLKRSVSATARVRLISTETGTILVSTTFTIPLEERKCGDERGSLASMEVLLNRALITIGESVANYITPHFELREFELERISTREYRERGETAAEAAEDLDVNEAYIHYWAIYSDDPYNPKVLYNIGVLHEVVGNYHQARDFYEMAVQLRDENRYEEALARTERGVAFLDALAEGGTVLAVHEFPSSAEDLSRAQLMEVRVRGRSEDRIPILMLPDQASDVVARVPGGVRFTVLQQAGDWLLVGLPGGRQGYIQRTSVESP
ncbi:MAG: hypothetical protein O7D29_02850 [Gemmatimonadetes bacterium]|nr:hypothetical protein [Gemmatimonadota bacterium]